MIVYVFIIIPSLRGFIPISKQRKEIMLNIRGKLILVVMISMVNLLGSGLFLIPRTGGPPILFSFATYYSTMLTYKLYLSILAMVIILLKLIWIDNIKKPKIRHRFILISVIINIINGIVITYLSVYLRYIREYS